MCRCYIHMAWILQVCESKKGEGKWWRWIRPRGYCRTRNRNDLLDVGAGMKWCNVSRDACHVVVCELFTSAAVWVWLTDWLCQWEGKKGHRNECMAMHKSKSKQLRITLTHNDRLLPLPWSILWKTGFWFLPLILSASPMSLWFNLTAKGQSDDFAQTAPYTCIRTRRWRLFSNFTASLTPVFIPRLLLLLDYPQFHTPRRHAVNWTLNLRQVVTQANVHGRAAPLLRSKPLADLPPTLTLLPTRRGTRHPALGRWVGAHTGTSRTFVIPNRQLLKLMLAYSLPSRRDIMRADCGLFPQRRRT